MMILRLPDGKFDSASIYDNKQKKTQDEINAESITVLFPSGEDQTQEIVAKLTADGVCQLGKGDFYVSNIVMPADTMLCGAGEATKLHFVDGASGNMVTIGERCTVCDISFYGAEEEIELNGDAVWTPAENETAVNLWKDGDRSITGGQEKIVLTQEIPAGIYKIAADLIREDDNTDGGVIQFSSSATASIGSANVLNTVYFTKNGRDAKTFTLNGTAKSVRIVSTNSSSDGLDSEYKNIRLTQITNDKCGICWTVSDASNSTAMFGIIRNCRFYNFNCAGVLMRDTGTATYHNLAVSDCFFGKNNVGIYIYKNSEYNKITNCCFSQNYFGMINRGGNNYISNCGFDSGNTGMHFDSFVGSNDGHGCISNCSFNHNTGYCISLNQTERMLITNCYFGGAGVLLKRTHGNLISNCGLNAGTIEIVGGRHSLIFGCFLKNGDCHITRENNTEAKAINCFYELSGTAVSITDVTAQSGA